MADNYATAAKLAQQAMDINNDLANDNSRPRHVHEGLNNGMKVLLQFAQVYATLALADEIRRGNSGWAQP